MIQTVLLLYLENKETQGNKTVDNQGTGKALKVCKILLTNI